MMHKAQKGMAKWTVRILLGLLIASFAMWGIADYATAPVNPPVAFVGDREISSNTFMNEAQRRINIVRQQQNRALDQRTAIQAGLYDQTLSALIDRNVLLDTADGWGMGLSDAQVAAEIRNDPAFQGPAGNFDRLRFDSILRNAGFSEGQFIQNLREDIINRQIESSMTAGLDRGHDVMARAILAFQLETRDVRMIVVPNDKIAAASEADEAALQAFHSENAARFSTPARRSGRVLHVTPAKLAENIIVDEQPIQNAYQDRIAEFSTPETRAIRQAILPDEAAAQAIVDRVTGGASFDDAVQEATSGPPIDLGVTQAGGLPGAVGDAAFAAAANSLAGPVQSAFGWHVIEVGDVTPEVVQPLEAVRDQIVIDLQIEQAQEELVDLSNRIEDELAGGGTAQDVAQAIEQTLVELPAISRAGETAEGATPAADLPRRALALLFTTAPGDELVAEETGDGSILLVETLSIEEPKLRPYAEVRDEVAAAWRANALADVADGDRDALVARLNGGETLEALAAEFGVEVTAEEGITRQSGLPLLAGPARQVTFGAETGKAVGAASITGDSQILSVVDAINPAELDEDDNAVDGIVSAIGVAFAEDIRARFVEGLREDVGFSVSQTAFRQAVDPNGIYLIDEQ